MSFFRFSVFKGGVGCIRSHPGAFTVVSLQKANRFRPNRSLSYQIRGFYAKLNLILKVKMVTGFTENVKIVSRNNAIHHFDICGSKVKLVCFSFFAFRFSLFVFRFSLFVIRYSLFGFTYFVFRYSFFVIRFSFSLFVFCFLTFEIGSNIVF